MAGFHPIEPIPASVVNRRCGAASVVAIVVAWVAVLGLGLVQTSNMRTITGKALRDDSIPITEERCHRDGVTGRRGAIGAAPMVSRSISGIARSS